MSRLICAFCAASAAIAACSTAHAPSTALPPLVVESGSAPSAGPGGTPSGAAGGAESPMRKLHVLITTALAGAALFLAAAAPAAAHVTLERAEATPGAGYKAVLRVPHGCDGSATLKVKVTVPEGVIAVKPMPKAGWTVAVTKGPYEEAYTFMHGLTLKQGVREIVWTGRLEDAFYDEFVFSGFVAEAVPTGSVLAVPVVQECEQGTAAWTEVPAPGQDPHALKLPAPLLRIVAPPEHHGHH